MRERPVFLSPTRKQGALHPLLALRAEVEALLLAHEKPQRVLDDPVASPPTIADPIAEGPGTVIGPYKLLQQIGEGGMGTVFMAEQTQPVLPKVALTKTACFPATP